jgi:putative Mg2+ transporter-C (MgtC) family protein
VFLEFFDPKISELWLEIGVKVVIATLCGLLIGIEREAKSKPAGIKTNILICVGACLYAIVGHLSTGGTEAGDPSRVSAQVVSGIGFLGAGTILQARRFVKGLTTAATIWVVAAIGVCIGSGYSIIALIFTLTVLFTLLVINGIERSFFPSLFGVEVQLTAKDNHFHWKVRDLFKDQKAEIRDMKFEEADGIYIVKVRYHASRRENRQLIREIATHKHVERVRQF